MKKFDRFKVLDGTALKIIAMISMIFDHVGDNFFPEMEWMRCIGRIAMPIFAFCLAEGFIHTHDRLKYLRRMIIFGIISEIPFDLVTAREVLEFSHQNIMLTFSWAILGLLIFEKIGKSELRTWAKNLLRVLVFILFVILSLVFMLDYNMVAVSLIFVFYLLREKGDHIRYPAAAGVHMLFRNVGIYWFGLLGFIPILLYNHKRGKGLKWLFYAFYPGHLLAIWALLRIMHG